MDPCLAFIDIDQNDLIACTDSVITSQSAVCNEEIDENITPYLSTLLSTSRYSYIFMSFIDSLITILDETIILDINYDISMDIFSLIRKSLYVYQLLQISVSIPYEWNVVMINERRV